MNPHEPPTHLDLFTGIGGFTLAFEAEGFRTIAFSEINEDKNLVLEHWWPHIPNLGPLETIPAQWPAFTAQLGRPNLTPDIITGGVPCQPASALGQMRGTADERWLWPQTIGVVRAVRPRFGLFENPPSLLILEDGRAWNGIVSAFCALGYDCWWDVFPAAAFGAGHLRERVLLFCSDATCIGHAQSWQHRKRRICKSSCAPSSLGQTDNGNARAFRSRGDDKVPRMLGRANSKSWWWKCNTGIPVLAHGLPTRLVEAAARCAGDSVVPQVIQPIARAIYQSLNPCHP